VQNLLVEECAADLANMRFAKLKNVAFEGCKLTGTDWTSAHLDGARFTDCDLSGAQFSQVNVIAARFERCTLDGVNGVSSLAGAVIDPANLLDLSHQLADALGITIATRQD
ncbi:MAG: pentapeptide repeat-containing protein, partial [Nocardioidaceae bacterium]